MNMSRMRALLGPFRNKSFIDRLLLGETEWLTHSPKRVGIDKFVIHPKNRLKMFFDTLVQGMTLYSVVMLPLKFAFGATTLPPLPAHMRTRLAPHCLPSARTPARALSSVATPIACDATPIAFDAMLSSSATRTCPPSTRGALRRTRGHQL
jgi:hypothetical protein